MPTPEALNNQTNFTFPQEIEVAITLRIRVTDQEARDYWLNPETGLVAVETLVDIIDSFTFSDAGDEHILSINNLTKAQLQQILNNEAAL